MKIGSELTEESAEFIHPDWWIYCESDYRWIISPRHAQTDVALCFDVMLKHFGLSHSSDIPESDSPQSNNNRG